MSIALCFFMDSLDILFFLKNYTVEWLQHEKVIIREMASI